MVQRLFMVGMVAAFWFAQSLNADDGPSFPNDLFFHHHPSQAFTQQGGNSRVAQSNANNGMGGPYSPNNYHGSGPYRAASYDPVSQRQASPWDNGNFFDPNARAAPYAGSAMPRQGYSPAKNERMSLTYTRNGGIDWNEHAARFANANTDPYRQNGGSLRSSNAQSYPYAAAYGDGPPLGSSPNPWQGYSSNPGRGSVRMSDAEASNEATKEDSTHGQGTFYDVETRVGACGQQVKNTDHVAALNDAQMGHSKEHCGKQAEVTGPDGETVTVTIVDGCSTCQEGGLDLSPAAFEKLGSFSHGSIPIKWKFVA